MRALCVWLLLLSSSVFAAEPASQTAPSTTAKAVKVMDWTAVSLISAGFVLRSASLLDDEARRNSGEGPAFFTPLFTAALGTLFGGLMTGLVSMLVKSVAKLNQPVSDVPGPWDFRLSSSGLGRVLQISGLAVVVLGVMLTNVGQLISRQPGVPLQIAGGFAAAAGLLTAAVGGELRDEPSLSLAPTTGGAVIGLSARW